tara:strand:- start:114 stop:515 length:402 start_codon:yes stop_codon:yes gene_type:complete
MVTAYEYDHRPEIASNGRNVDKMNSYNKAQMNQLKNKIFLENKDKTKLNNNKFMNMTVEQIYDKIVNLIPNLYNDYHKKYLETSLNLKNDDKFVSENIVVKETLKDMILNNENMIYLGIVFIIISFLLYMINL